MQGLTCHSARAALAAAAAAAVVATGLALAGNDGDSRAQAQSGGPAAKQIGSFTRPVQVAGAPGRPKLLYIVEQRGLIRTHRNGRKLGRPFLDIRHRVRFRGGEPGLLSVAFHPKSPRNRSFFVFYTNKAGNIEVDRFKSRPRKPARANPQSRRKVIEIPHPSNSHFGGQLRFGLGGRLFMTTGDGSGGRDPEGNAQNNRILLGKLLRIIPRPRGGHRSPPANPFFGQPGRNEIYSFGFRNPWGFSFDRKTGDLWIADVGEKRWEEINRVTRGQARGANFGWNCREGPEEFEGASGACARHDRSAFTDPIHAYPVFDRPECAVIGGYVARGREVPQGWRGRYVYGDYCTGEIRLFSPANPAATDRPTGLNVGFGLSSLGEDQRGALYATKTDGSVYRIVSR